MWVVRTAPGFPLPTVLGFDIFALNSLCDELQAIERRKLYEMAVAVRIGSNAEQKDWKSFEKELLTSAEEKRASEGLSSESNKSKLRRLFS